MITKQGLPEIISDDMALGLFDGDGGILINVNKGNKRAKPHNSLGFAVFYSFGQSASKHDNVQKFAEKFGTNAKKVHQGFKFSENQSSEIGKKVRLFLLKNKPLHPGRRLDFLLSEKVIQLLNQNLHLTMEGAITVCYLMYSKHKDRPFNNEKFDALITLLNPSQVDLDKSKSAAKQMLKPIHQELKALRESYTKRIFSDDYVLGCHYSDGGFTVSLAGTNLDMKRFRVFPEWSISGQDKDYCQAFVNKFSAGRTNKLNEGNEKFIISGINDCNNLLEFFEKASWMPAYKKEQYVWFKQAVTLMVKKKHLTFDGYIQLVEMVYGKSEKRKRTKDKEMYIIAAKAWFSKKQKHTSS